MSFQYPYALLVLLAIPVLILIYILRNRYKEATAPSTYLWEISQKFLKKRNPFHSRENLIALFVQRFAIAFMAVTLAHPVLSFKNSAEQRVFVLDGSASRNRRKDYRNKETKFEAAKADILAKVNQAKKGSTFSLIRTGEEEPRTICQGISDPGQFQRYLDTLSCSFTKNDISSSLSLAQKWVSMGNGSEVILATDQKVDVSDNIEVRSYYNDKQTNYAITNLTYEEKSTPSESGANINVSPTYVCYDHDNALFRIRFYVDGKDRGVVRAKPESAGLPVTSTYELKVDDPSAIKNITAKIEELTDEEKKGYHDVLAEDNVYTLYPAKEAKSSNVLLVSSSPLFLKSAFKSFGHNVTVISPSAYNKTSGYDIYVFDGYAPKELPTDGAIWFFGIDEQRDDVGFNYEHTYSDEADGYTATYANNDDNILYQEITKNLAKKDVLRSKYNRYTLNEDFTTILSYNNIPLIFAGKNSFNQREVVFSFTLSDSSLPLTYDFPVMVRNLALYSNPELISNLQYVTGDDATINVSDSIQERELVRPDGKSTPLVLGSSQYLTYELDQVGTYTLKTKTNNNTDKEVTFFVSYPKEEGSPLAADDNQYTLVRNADTKKANAIYDSILPVAIAAALFFGADWILYAREQY